jgi:cytoskeleton protein RodZ
MSEHTTQPPQAVAQPEPGQSMPSAGALLRQAREAEGIHIAELALALKVSVKKLEALEADRLDLLPDAVFVRALASGVCRALKIDPTPILDQLPQTAVPRLEFDGAGLNTPFQTPGDVSSISVWYQLSKPVMLTALVLLAGALVLIFFPSMDHVLGSLPASGDTTGKTQTPAVAERAAASVVKPAATPEPAIAAPTVTPKPQAVKQPVATAPAGPASSAPALVAKVPPAQVAENSVQAPASSALITTVQGKATSSGIIVFRTQGPSWIEVTDAQGVIQIRRTVEEGEVVGVSGPLPLSVIVGRADMTEVQVRGKPFALTSITRENVARFEVK